MIGKKLIDAGILQLGLFTTEAQAKTYRLRLDMLPCYPELFQVVIEDAVQHLSRYKFDYLLAHSNAAVLAGAIAHQANVRLIYSRGRGESTALDLVGAYDVGHSALLLVTCLDDLDSHFINRAARVGLNVKIIMPIIDTGITFDDLDIAGFYQLADIIEELAVAERIPLKQVRAILEEITARV